MFTGREGRRKGKGNNRAKTTRLSGVPREPVGKEARDWVCQRVRTCTYTEGDTVHAYREGDMVRTCTYTEGDMG